MVKDTKGWLDASLLCLPIFTTFKNQIVRSDSLLRVSTVAIKSHNFSHISATNIPRIPESKHPSYRTKYLNRGIDFLFIRKHYQSHFSTTCLVITIARQLLSVSDRSSDFALS